MGDTSLPSRLKKRATMVTQGHLEESLAAFEESHGSIVFPEVWIGSSSFPCLQGLLLRPLWVQTLGLPAKP